MKKRVFVSGVTGMMGRMALKHLLLHLDQLEIVCLVRDSDVLSALSGVDYILHMAALVSPEADHHPELAMKINVGSVEHLLRAVSDLSLTYVKFVYIASVAE